MFPPIKVQAMNLSTCKRVVMFNLTNDENGEPFIEFRHYGVSARQRAVNKGIKKVINNKKVPDMSKFNDLADYILHNNRVSGGMSSESEMDDLPESKIVLPEDYQDKKGGTSVAIKLHELGPRLKMRLLKIEEGLCRGNVVFHSVIQKSKADIKKQLDSLKGKRELKEKRKKQQEENVKRKQEKLESKNKVEESKDQAKKKKNDDDNDGEEEGTTKVFTNFMKDGYVPNIASAHKRAPGISKGMWKKEHKRQLTGSVEKKERRGRREKKDDGTSTKVTLGKRAIKQTATLHKKNTSTFKSQHKPQKRQKTSSS